MAPTAKKKSVPEKPLTRMEGAFLAFWLLFCTENIFMNFQRNDDGSTNLVLTPPDGMTEAKFLNKFSAALGDVSSLPKGAMEARFKEIQDLVNKTSVPMQVTQQLSKRKQVITADINFGVGVLVARQLFQEIIRLDAGMYQPGQVCSVLRHFTDIIPPAAKKRTRA